MKTKTQIILIVLSVALLLSFGVFLSLAQEEQPGNKNTPTRMENNPVASYIPIQGRLTNSSGNPLSGNYSVRFNIYDVDSEGTALCSTTKTINIVNGLFSDTMSCASGIIDGRQLWLGIKVGDDAEMTPRQPIYPVPYAWSLIPATSIKGSTVHSAILELKNDGNGPALYASGNGIIKSSAATDWVVSPLKMVQEESVNNNDLNIIPSSQFGYVKLYTDGKDDCTALLPVDMPAYLFGTRIKLDSFYFWYKMDNVNDKITTVDVKYISNDGSSVSLCNFNTEVSSTTWASGVCDADPPADVYGPVFIKFSLHFAGDGESRGIRFGELYLHLTEE